MGNTHVPQAGTDTIMIFHFKFTLLFPRMGLEGGPPIVM